MFAPIRRATLFALYQLSVLAGICLLPVALVARRAGVPFPVHRLVESLGTSYEKTKDAQP
jgi:hypothetical protein